MDKPEANGVDHAKPSMEDRRIDHGNAAVLLDIGAAHIEGGESGLKLAKDGHVSKIVLTDDSPSYGLPDSPRAPTFQ